MTPQERARLVDPAALRDLVYDEEFHSLLADIIKEAVLEEREACAKIADSVATIPAIDWNSVLASERIAEEIRDRSQEATVENYRG